MKPVLLVISITCLFLSTLSGQVNGKIMGSSLPAIQKMLHNEMPIPKLLNGETKGAFQGLLSAIETKQTAILTRPMPLAYAYKDLAIFCKLEVKMEKIVKMPIKFRLGSVDYVDWLEGKRDRY